MSDDFPNFLIFTRISRKGKIFYTHIDYGNGNIWHRDNRSDRFFCDSFNDDKTITNTVTNVLKRMRMLTKVQSNVLFYDTYFVKEHDTVDLVSEKIPSETIK